MSTEERIQEWVSTALASRTGVVLKLELRFPEEAQLNLVIAVLTLLEERNLEILSISMEERRAAPDPDTSASP